MVAMMVLRMTEGDRHRRDGGDEIMSDGDKYGDEQILVVLNRNVMVAMTERG